MLREKLVAREHHAVGFVSVARDQQCAHVGAPLPGKKWFVGDKTLLNKPGVAHETRQIPHQGDEVEFHPQLDAHHLEPGRAGPGHDGLAFQVAQVAQRMVSMKEDALRIALHLGADHLDRHASRHGHDHVVTIGHAQVGPAHRHRGHDLRVGSARDDYYIETLGGIIPLRERLIITAVFRLRKPVGLETDLNQRARCGRGLGLLSAARKQDNQQ